jgi:uncharacterized protein (DUF1015 family)
MATIIPFRGVLYDSSLVGNVRDVVAPPYDIIDTDMQKALHERHPQNVIRLELGIEESGDNVTSNKYTRAASFLRGWLNSGALRRDSQPALYYHTIDYRPPGSGPAAPTRMLKSFLATVQLEEFGTGKIYPHENTRAAAKTDRLNLLEACRANFSPIWSLYSDPSGRVLQGLEQAAATEKPRIDFVDDVGCRQRLWSITNPAVLDQVTALMRSIPLFIADGHHRYETALNYQRFRRQQRGASGTKFQPYDSVLMLFAGLEDPGLTVLATHRVVTTPVPTLDQLRSLLSPDFDITEFAFTREGEAQARRRFLDELRNRGASTPVFGLAIGGGQAYCLLKLRAARRPPADSSPRERLDVSILQQQVVAKLCPTQKEQEAIVYTKDEHEALDWVRKGTGQAALLLNPTKVIEVQAVASAGERMPHKSTYFFPKPLTGLVMNVFEEADSG